MKTLIALIIFLFTSTAYAQVYKCIVSGQTRYQQAPCPRESSSEKAIELIPNIVSTKGLRQYMEQDKEPKKRRDKKEKKANRAKRKWMDEEVDTFAKRVDKTRALERKQKIKEKKERDRRKPRS